MLFFDQPASQLSQYDQSHELCLINIDFTGYEFYPSF